MAKVAFYQHPACGRHDTGWNHPEHQGRLRTLLGAVYAALPELGSTVEGLEGEPASPELLSLVHEPGYVEYIQQMVGRAAELGDPVRLDSDTAVSEASWAAALSAAGCAVSAVQAVCGGEAGAAFCAVRPPGHHATSNRAMGFCIFNNVAVAARYAVHTDRAKRVLILDWDVHHGNGTQEIFYEDPRVFYLSMHQSPHYPGTGAREETGSGPGEGTTLNLPLGAGLPAHRYVCALLDGLDEVLQRFAPELVFISAGFDAALHDPLGGFTLEAEDFGRLTREVVRRTWSSASGRVVSVLEGGYNPQELGHNVVAHLVALRDALGTC